MDHDGAHHLEDEDDDHLAEDGISNRHDHEGESSSLESTPERDLNDQGPSKDAAPPQKRKGGRKPIYATSEERKQRNRQAQAAFRERRTEYIKQLEATIKQNEEALATLQQNHRSAADECLMLRYKNSLLERILLEKGIDVQAELQLKAGSPTFASPIVPSTLVGAHMQGSRAQLQRTAVQRHHARRSASTIASSYGAPQTMPAGMQAGQTAMTSPQTVPTPSSHISSPTDPSAGSPSVLQTAAGMTPPAQTFFSQTPQRQQDITRPDSSVSTSTSSDQRLLSARQMSAAGFAGSIHMPVPPSRHGSQQLQNQTRQPQKQQPARSVPRPSSGHQNMRLYTPPAATASSDMNAASIAQSASVYYPSPFQKHIDQLEQEYDTETMSQSMLDQFDHEPTNPIHDRTSKSSYLQNFDPNTHQAFHDLNNAIDPQAHNHNPQQLTPHSQDGSAPFAVTSTQSHHTSDALEASYNNLAHMIDPDDPLLDADPFGLTASMHYSTSYHYEQQPRR